jgi:manganese transport protein
MGTWVDRPLTTVAGAVVAALVIGLDAHLLLGFVLG